MNGSCEWILDTRTDTVRGKILDREPHGCKNDGEVPEM